MRAVLLILDGAGYAPPESGNAVTAETMPNLFAAFRTFGRAVLEAAGPAVGLDEGQVGNSEVGHLTIGAGEIVTSMLRRIHESYLDGSWSRHALWRTLAAHERLHIVGLLSDAGVHGHWRTLYQAAKLAASSGVGEVVVHPVLDGVDSQDGTASALFARLQGALAGTIRVRFGVISGRRHFCDRSGRLELSRRFSDAVRERSDLPLLDVIGFNPSLPSVGEADFSPHLYPGGLLIGRDDPILLTSHRADRASQVAGVLAETNSVFGMVELMGAVPRERAFFPATPRSRGLTLELRNHHIYPFRVAESCKFPHVTYFFDGLNPEPVGDAICVPSVPESDIPDHPEMAAADIATHIIRAIGDDRQRVIVANLANLDQLGHSGVYNLAIRAAAVVDQVFSQIERACRNKSWFLVVTADHGNADRMWDAEGNAFGSHTDRPVPLTVIPPKGAHVSWVKNEGTLANVAATFLRCLDIPTPPWMAPSLIAPIVRA